MLQYELEPTIVTETIQWEDKKFDVNIITQQNISLKLDQPNKRLSFEVEEPNQFVTLIIPQELLWNPYEVLLNDKPIKKQERMGEDNLVWLHLKPNDTGTIEIIGVSVVPEFPFAMILVLSISMMVAVYANRLSRR
jgi:predicted secreted protein with PEFG-CTERM motif